MFTLDDLRELEARITRANQEKRPFYDQIGHLVRDAVAEREANNHLSTASSGNDITRGTDFGRSDFGNNFDFTKYLSTLNEEDMLARCVCGICADFAVDATITDCKHVFCRECIQIECNKAAAQSDFTECPVCQHAFGSTTPFKDLVARESDVTIFSDDEDSEIESSQRRRKGKKKSDSPWLNLPGELLPSAKTIALKQQILKWHLEAPDDKIVVFTQFRLMYVSSYSFVSFSVTYVS